MHELMKTDLVMIAARHYDIDDLLEFWNSGKDKPIDPQRNSIEPLADLVLQRIVEAYDPEITEAQQLDRCANDLRASADALMNMVNEFEFEAVQLRRFQSQESEKIAATAESRS